MSEMPLPGANLQAGRREWVGLALPTLLVSIDVFVMLLALPHWQLAVRHHAYGRDQVFIAHYLKLVEGLSPLPAARDPQPRDPASHRHRG